MKKHQTNVEQEIEMAMNQVLVTIKRMDEKFRGKTIQKLRRELLMKIPSLALNEESKSYFIHQIAYAHTIEELVKLTREINRKQALAQ